MDSRLRRFPPNHASVVPYGQAMENASRFPPLAHRPAAVHKLHSAQATILQIRELQNHLPGIGLSLFFPGGCPSYRDHRSDRADPRDALQPARRLVFLGGRLDFAIELGHPPIEFYQILA